jgi:hypothetical protein
MVVGIVGYLFDVSAHRKTVWFPQNSLWNCLKEHKNKKVSRV